MGISTEFDRYLQLLRAKVIEARNGCQSIRFSLLRMICYIVGALLKMKCQEQAGGCCRGDQQKAGRRTAAFGEARHRIVQNFGGPDHARLVVPNRSLVNCHWIGYSRHNILNKRMNVVYYETTGIF